MRNLTIALCSLLFSSIAFADSVFVYDGPQTTGRNQVNRDAYEACVKKFTGAIQPGSLRLSKTYYAGKSLDADRRIFLINGSFVRDGERVNVGIACKTNYRGQRVTSLKASIGAHYAMHEGAGK